MEAYIQEHLEQLRTLIRELCVIPAPSFREGRRAAFLREWLEAHGAEGVTVDTAQNVVWPMGNTEEGPLTVFMAHTDTVFPDLEPMPFREENGRYYCPGVTDDTAQLAVLLISALFFKKRLPKHGVLIVANACEEGLGNLKGSRAIVERYGSRMEALVTIDGTNLHEIVSKAVGSHRYRVTALTEGGHSFGDFGKPSAIHALAGLISELCRQPVPQEDGSKTTYNVGCISGGTSVNTIAQQAEMLYEYRSDSRACLSQMEAAFRTAVAQMEGEGVRFRVEKIGDRPCAGAVDPEKQQHLLQRAGETVRKVTGREPVFRSGSTDCNAALGAGIPAVCIGGCIGGGCHTREEYLELDSLADGCRLVMRFLSHYFEEEK